MSEVIFVETSELGHGSQKESKPQEGHEAERLSNLAQIAEQFEEPGDKILIPQVTIHRLPSCLTSLSVALTFYRQWEIQKARLQGIIDK